MKNRFSIGKQQLLDRTEHAVIALSVAKPLISSCEICSCVGQQSPFLIPKRDPQLARRFCDNFDAREPPLAQGTLHDDQISSVVELG